MFFNDVNEAIGYIINVGGYDLNGKLNRDNFKTYQEWVNALYKIAHRISRCMATYPEEIYGYLKSHPEKEQCDLQELKNMRYKELSELRQSLGIRKKRSKKAKKVTRVEPVEQTTLEQAKQSLLTESVATTAKKICLSNLQDDIEEEMEETFLSADEIETMYGEDLPSIETLMSQGIIPLDKCEYEKRIKKLIP